LDPDPSLSEEFEDTKGVIRIRISKKNRLVFYIIEYKCILIKKNCKKIVAIGYFLANLSIMIYRGILKMAKDFNCCIISLSLGF
jgi:hypothetical protein